MHMPINQGYLKEDEMVEFLNGKTVSSLSDNLHQLLVRLFGVVDPNEKIKCEYCEQYTKPDFKVTYKGESRYVSMKSGDAETIHSEKVQTLIPFLRSIGVSKETLKTLLLYQFGDGTTNGTGQKRYNNHETYIWLKSRIQAANAELNTDEMTEKIFERIVYQGVKDTVKPADCIYHGNYENGFLATKKQISLYIKDKDWSYLENLHVGPLLMRPHARYAGVPIRNENNRIKMDFYWPKLKLDIIYISKKYYDYESKRNYIIEEAKEEHRDTEDDDCCIPFSEFEKKFKQPKKGLLSKLKDCIFG